MRLTYRQYLRSKHIRHSGCRVSANVPWTIIMIVIHWYKSRVDMDGDVGHFFVNALFPDPGYNPGNTW